MGIDMAEDFLSVVDRSASVGDDAERPAVDQGWIGSELLADVASCHAGKIKREGDVSAGRHRRVGIHGQSKSMGPTCAKLEDQSARKVAEDRQFIQVRIAGP